MIAGFAEDLRVLTEGDGAGERERRRLPTIRFRPLYLQSFHSVAECVGMESEDLCSAPGTFYSPVRLLENSHNMISLDVHEGFDRCGAAGPRVGG
jgi:hypothetical protein